MRILDDARGQSVDCARLYLTVDEAREFHRGLGELLRDPEANEHFHVFDSDGRHEISCSIVTPAKLARGAWTEAERAVLRGTCATIAHPAPWGRALWVVSSLAAALCLGSTVALCLKGGHGSLAFTPLLLLAATVPFLIRSYTVVDGHLCIRRLGWSTRVPLEGLVSATVEAGVMARSLRLCGNGGLFSFTGWFWNRKLGTYRAFVTDLHRTVVLRFAHRRIVVSPADPSSFVSELNASIGTQRTSVPPESD